MRRTVLSAVLLIVPGAAMGQDPAPPAAVGTLLLDSLPAQADIVVESPNLPALFASATKAGLGDAAAWRAAFDEQLRVWGAGAPTSGRLVTGGDALLAAADGEVLLASVALNLPDAQMPRVRATIFAMRSSRDAKTLLAAFHDVADGGLRLRYDGIARTEEIAGRPVLALPGAAGTLYVTIQDGLLVASDHALALGLFFRGLSREQVAAPANRPPAASLELAVRHGRDAAAWEGWIWGGAESVAWTPGDGDVAKPFVKRAAPSTSGVFIVGRSAVADLPLFPSPISRINRESDPGADFIGIDAGHSFEGRGDAPAAASNAAAAISGGAWRLGWLGAMANGKLELPFPDVAAASLRAPFESASKIAGDTTGEFIAWKPSKEPDHLSGPVGHGPATLLALRCLHDIARGIAPGETAPLRAVPKTRTDAPLPEPVEPRNK
jgi:hypothetical protein